MFRRGAIRRLPLITLTVLALLLAACGDATDSPDDVYTDALAATATAGGAPTPHAGRPDTGPTDVLTNGRIALALDRRTGHVLQIADLTKAAPLPFLDSSVMISGGGAPVAVTRFGDGGGPLCTVSYPPRVETCDQGDACRRLTWACGEHTVEATIYLPAGRAAVRFQAGVTLNGPGRVYSVAYPILGALRPLAATPADDVLALPLEGGLAIRNPLPKVREQTAAPENFFRQLTYPHGHSLMLQMAAYYGSGVGGFLAYTPDPSHTAKLIGFSDLAPAEPDPRVAMWVSHVNWSVDDSAFALDYPVEIAALPTGDWHAAAEIYRDWAVAQPWAAEPIAARAAADRDLFDTAGFSVFGLSAREDQTAWYRAFHDEVCAGIPDARVLFVPGWDFHPNADLVGDRLHAFYQAGWDAKHWLPYQGDFVDNYQVIKQGDDFVYPFVFDLLLHDTHPAWDGWDGQEPDDAGAPWSRFEMTDASGNPASVVEPYPFVPGNARAISPADPTVRDFWLWRQDLLGDVWQDGVHIVLDGFYHDISATIVAQADYRETPDRPWRGAGRWMTEAVRDMYGEALGDGPVRAASFGIENVTEPLVDVVDFYHLGAAGLGPFRSPVPGDNPDEPTFEGVHRWVMTGEAAEIPLFAYVYHAYGAMRTGGKIQMSRQIGDAFYWAVASEYLWGGLTELIYFNTWVDLMPTITADEAHCPGSFPCAFQTGWLEGEGGNRGWHAGEEVREADPEKIAFLRRAVRLRLQAAPRYLVDGVMLAPPTLDPPAPSVAYDYDFYSHIRGPRFYHRGKFTAPAVQVEAWRTYAGDGVAFILANSTTQKRRATLTFDPAAYDIAGTRAVLIEVGTDGLRETVLNNYLGPNTTSLSVTLTARAFSVTEFRNP